MTKIISLHSFRGGTGKSNSVANLAAVLACRGKRVGIVDTDIVSPGIHVLFGMGEGSVAGTLNDYLWGRCAIADATYEVTAALEAQGGGFDPAGGGRVWLIPSSLKPGEIARILREGYDVGLLNDGIQRLITDLRLDALLIDTHPGLNEETLLSIAISDVLVIILRPDAQDYQGTGVTVEVARRLDVPRMVLVVNKVPTAFDAEAVRDRVARTYGCDVLAVLPHSDDMMALASAGLFVLRHPAHPLSDVYRRIADDVMG